MASSAWAIRVGVDLDTSDIQSQLDKAAQGTKVNIDTGEAEGNLKNLSGSFDLTYQMANKLYQMSKQAIEAMVEEVKEVDKALTEFKKVSDLRGSDLDDYSKDLAVSGREVARTMSDMIDAATMFRKSGFSDEEASQLAVVASMYQNIADTQVSAEQAAASIVSQIRAFGEGVIDPMHIIDSYNEVANNFSVGTNDLSTAMEIASAGLATYGNSFEEILGLVTSGSEIFVGRSGQVARGLTTIAARIAGADGQKALKEYGIEVENLDGSLRSTYDVLGDVAKIWGDLSDAQKVALGETLAGKTRYNILAAVLQNYQHAIDATTTALNSEGSATEENAAYMDSLEARIERMNGLFQELSTTVVGSDLVGGILDLASSFLELANTPIGGFVTKVGLLSTGLSGLYGMLKAGILSEGVLGVALPSLGAMLPYIAAGTVAVVGLYEGIKKVKEILQEKIEAKIFENVASEIEESENKIKNYDKLISDSKDKLNELKSIPWGERTTEIDFEIQKLESLIQQYEKLREEEERKVREDKLKKLRNTEYESGYKMVQASDYIVSDLESNFAGFQEVYDKAVSGYYATIEDAALAFGKVMDIAYNADDTLEDRVAEVMAVLESQNVYLQRSFHGWTEELQQNTAEMSEYANSLKDLDAVNESTIPGLEELINKNQSYYDTLRIVKKYGGELSAEELNFMSQYEQMSGILSQVTVGMDKLSAAQKKVQQLQDSAFRGNATLTLQDYVNVLNNLDGIDTSNLGDVLGYLKSIGAINLDYTASDLQEIIDQINSVESKDVQLDINADAEDVVETIDEAKEAIESMNEETGVTITSSADASNLIESLNTIKQLIGELNTMSISIKINVSAGSALSTLRNIRSAVTSIPTYWGITIYCTDYASASLNNIINLLNRITDKTITVKVDRDDLSGKATGSNYFGGGPVLINDGAPVNGSAGELVVANGKAQIYNDGEPTIEDLPKGAKIYTAAQTQQILKNIKALKDSIPAYADGNITIPSEINAETIRYNPSEYYGQNTFGPFYSTEEFDQWQKERKHLLELDLITQEQYYLDLEEMNETYLKNMEDSQDKYWSYQEEIYKWKKSRLEDENKLLEKQIELEKALGDLAKIKSQKILVFKNGKFQYMADVDAISEAQRNINSILTDKGYADGTTNAKAGLHLVGENGPELRVLNSGDGIIPNNLTNRLLNMARMGVNGLSNTTEKAKQAFYSFDISNITLPSVRNAEDFFDGLKNYAYQYSYA